MSDPATASTELAAPSLDRGRWLAESTISHRLACFAHDLHYEDIPAPVRERAKHLILDATGIALAAHQFEFAQRMMNGICALSEGGKSSVIGTSQTLPLRDAVLMNGALIHGLDYDDTHMRAIVHATAACLPVMLGVGEQVGAHGRDALAAYVVGMEAATRIGAAAKGGFHHAGFHATGIVAHFAAALMAGRFYGLSTDQLAAAQGITASTASAVQVFLEEGTWSKRLHPGWGGVGGITAARLAEHGFLAPSRPYEGRYGLFDSHLQEHAKDVDYAAITERLGEVWEIEAEVIKPYPICHFLHACVEAAIELHDKGLEAGEVQHIRVLLPPDTIEIVTEPWDKKCRPQTDYEAKFSAQYTVAAALVRGRFGLADLQPQALADEAVLTLAGRTEVAADPETAFPRFFSGGVEVTLKTGNRLRAHRSVNKGAGDRVISNADIISKYDETAGLTVSQSQADQICERILALDSADLLAVWEVLGIPPVKAAGG